jgi:hypothetical protein
LSEPLRGGKSVERAYLRLVRALPNDVRALLLVVAADDSDDLDEIHTARPAARPAVSTPPPIGLTSRSPTAVRAAATAWPIEVAHLCADVASSCAGRWLTTKRGAVGVGAAATPAGRVVVGVAAGDHRPRTPGDTVDDAEACLGEAAVRDDRARRVAVPVSVVEEAAVPEPAARSQGSGP